MQRKQTLALVMIVKNEELGLEAAINSCKEFVDEIIIAVDNSSKDRTLEIATKYATTLKTFDWKDDFAAARNFAQEGVKADWLFFLDGHEVVSKCEKLQEFLNQDCDALICTVELEDGSQFRNPRIYKNGLKFEGAVHEVQNLKKPVWYPYFVVKHNRHKMQSQTAVTERSKQRDEQVPRIFKERLKKNPADIRASFHLAMFLPSKGKLKEAYKYQKIYLKYSKITDERWFVYFNRALLLLSENKKLRATWACDNADKETPGRWEIAKMRGLVFFQQKKYAKALDCFVESFKTNVGYVAYNPWPRDDGNTWSLIGECFFNLGEYFKASVAFGKASEKSKDNDFKELNKKRADLMERMSIAK